MREPEVEKKMQNLMLDFRTHSCGTLYLLLAGTVSLVNHAAGGCICWLPWLGARSTRGMLI